MVINADSAFDGVDLEVSISQVNIRLDKPANVKPTGRNDLHVLSPFQSSDL